MNLVSHPLHNRYYNKERKLQMRELNKTLMRYYGTVYGTVENQET